MRILCVVSLAVVGAGCGDNSPSAGATGAPAAGRAGSDSGGHANGASSGRAGAGSPAASGAAGTSGAGTSAGMGGAAAAAGGMAMLGGAAGSGGGAGTNGVAGRQSAGGASNAGSASNAAGVGGVAGVGDAGAGNAGVGGVSGGAGLGGGTIVPGLNNPIARHLYTADPAALVHDDTLYVYTGHDEAGATQESYVMNNWHVFSTRDMAHWKDHGAVMSIGDFSWARGSAWAGQTIERDGKFYWYVPVDHKTIPGFAIGVAVGDSPSGPFEDARGSALITNDMTTNVTIAYDDIDPTAFVDDDGQAYLYWGNTSCKVVKLAADMTSISGSITYLQLQGFTEAPYVNKINGTYYLSYAAGFPETIDYATSSSPLGPFTRRGTVNRTIDGSGTNHQSLIEFRNTWYFVYHSAALPGGGDYHRSVSIDLLPLHADGSIGEVLQTADGITALDPGPFSDAADYRLVSRSGGRVLDVEGSSTEAGANIEQISWQDLDSQRWQLKPVGSGVYQLVNRHSGACAGVANASLADGANVEQSPCAGSPALQWRLLITAVDDYAFINVASGKALGLAQSSSGEGANLAQYPYTGSTLHSWQVLAAP